MNLEEKGEFVEQNKFHGIGEQVQKTSGLSRNTVYYYLKRISKAKTSLKGIEVINTAYDLIVKAHEG